MNFRPVFAVFCALCVFMPVLRAAEPPSPKVLLQEALFAEEAERDLAKAGAGYTALLAEFATQRTLAATALYRLAEVRAKEHKPAEAIALHQRLLAEFPQEEALVKLSRGRLAELGAAAPAVVAGGTAEPISAKEAEELARLRRMVKDSPDLLDAPNEQGDTPLVAAASAGFVQAAEFLLDHHVAINGHPNSWVPLHWAAQYGRKRMVELLLARGADVNAAGKDGWTALQAATHRNYLEVARVLLEKGAKPDVQVEPDYRNVYSATEVGTPLVVATRKGAVELVKLLLEKGADPNSTSHKPEQTALGAAAETGSLELVKLLLEHGAKIDQSQQSRTPLMIATLHDQLPVVKLLLSKGARVDLADEFGAMALHYAAATADLAEPLLAAGASPKATTKSGLTPLHFTVLGRSSLRRLEAQSLLGPLGTQRLPVEAIPKVWDQLLAKGAGLNAVDEQGYSLLHYACGVSELPLKEIEQLIAKGADPELKAKDGTLPIWLSPQREELERKFLLPKLVKKRAVTVMERSHSGLDGAGLGFGTAMQTYEPSADAPEPPTWERVLRKSTGMALRPSWKLTLYRAEADGGVKEAGSSEGQMTPVKADTLPKLQWGDVVVLTDGNGSMRPPRVINARQ